MKVDYKSHNNRQGLREAIEDAVAGDATGIKYCRFVVSELGRDGPEPYVIAVCEALVKWLDEFHKEIAESN